MAQTLILGHERVDDIPLIIGLANKLHLAEILDHHMGTHRLQQGMNNGQLAVGWLAYILSQADHRKSAVRDWANGIPHTLAHLLGHPIREVEFSDDRLGGVARHLRRDNWASVRYDEGLNSSKSSVTLQSTDRHDILGQKSAGFPLSLGARDAKCAPHCPQDGLLQE